MRSVAELERLLAAREKLRTHMSDLDLEKLIEETFRRGDVRQIIVFEPGFGEKLQREKQADTEQYLENDSRVDVHFRFLRSP